MISIKWTRKEEPTVKFLVNGEEDKIATCIGCGSLVAESRWDHHIAWHEKMETL